MADLGSLLADFWLVWIHFWLIVGSSLAHHGIISRSSWHHFRLIMASFSGHHGGSFGSSWDHFWIILGSFWGHLGIILGSLWDQSGIILGSFWDHVGTIWGHVAIVPSRPNETVARTGRSPERPDSRQNGPRQIGARSEARLEVPPGWPERQNGQNAR